MDYYNLEEGAVHWQIKILISHEITYLTTAVSRANDAASHRDGQFCSLDFLGVFFFLF